MINLQLNISQKELANALICHKNRQDLFELIKTIDLTVAELDFTEKLRDYFVSEMEKENAETK
jgi:hypothetical protein